jgi:pyrroline-5-carboxylate reductase
VRLRRTLATDAALVRAIPLPAVRERRSVTVTCPSNPVVNALFERLGGSLPVADVAAFNVLSALTATLTTHYWYLATLTSWAIGINERIRTTWFDPANSAALGKALDDLLADLNAPKTTGAMRSESFSESKK